MRQLRNMGKFEYLHPAYQITFLIILVSFHYTGHNYTLWHL